MVSERAGIWKKMLATAASRTTIIPTNRNFPMPLKSRLLIVATVDSVKKMVAVPPAESAIIEPPFEKPRATWRIRDSIRPMKKVKPSRRATPRPLFLFFSMAHMNPQERGQRDHHLGAGQRGGGLGAVGGLQDGLGVQQHVGLERLGEHLAGVQAAVGGLGT